MTCQVSADEFWYFFQQLHWCPLQEFLVWLFFIWQLCWYIFIHALVHLRHCSGTVADRHHCLVTAIAPDKWWFMINLFVVFDTLDYWQAKTNGIVFFFVLKKWCHKSPICNFLSACDGSSEHQETNTGSWLQSLCDEWIITVIWLRICIMEWSTFWTKEQMWKFEK